MFRWTGNYLNIGRKISLTSTAPRNVFARVTYIIANNATKLRNVYNTGLDVFFFIYGYIYVIVAHMNTPKKNIIANIFTTVIL